MLQILEKRQVDIATKLMKCVLDKYQHLELAHPRFSNKEWQEISGLQLLDDYFNCVDADISELFKLHDEYCDAIVHGWSETTLSGIPLAIASEKIDILITSLRKKYALSRL